MRVGRVIYILQLVSRFSADQQLVAVMSEQRQGRRRLLARKHGRKQCRI